MCCCKVCRLLGEKRGRDKEQSIHTTTDTLACVLLSGVESVKEKERGKEKSDTYAHSVTRPKIPYGLKSDIRSGIPGEHLFSDLSLCFLTTIV